MKCKSLAFNSKDGQFVAEQIDHAPEKHWSLANEIKWSTYLESPCPSLEKAFKKNALFTDLDDWFELMENIRHCIVHNDQIPKGKLIELIKKHKKLFDRFFMQQELTNRILTDYYNSEQVVKYMMNAFFYQKDITVHLLNGTRKNVTLIGMNLKV